MHADPRHHENAFARISHSQFGQLRGCGGEPVFLPEQNETIKLSPGKMSVKLRAYFGRCDSSSIQHVIRSEGNLKGNQGLYAHLWREPIRFKIFKRPSTWPVRNSKSSIRSAPPSARLWTSMRYYNKRSAWLSTSRAGILVFSICWTRPKSSSSFEHRRTRIRA